MDQQLLEILCCPKCKGELEQREQGFACGSCKLLYRIQDGIPNFLIDEAKPLETRTPKN